MTAGAGRHPTQSVRPSCTVGSVIAVPTGIRPLLATRPMDSREGVRGLAALASKVLHEGPFGLQSVAPTSFGRVPMIRFSEAAPSLLWHVHHSEKYNYVYVDTPKVACSTIKYTLQSAEAASLSKFDTHSYNNPYGYSDFLLSIHDRSQNTLKAPSDRTQMHDFIKRSKLVFCFVRNPYTRVLSAYIDKILTNKTRRATFLKELGIVSTDHHNTVSFVEFLKLIERQTPADTNAHWRHQYFHLMTDEIKFGFVGCFERFSTDFSNLCSMIDPNLHSFVQTVDEHKTGSENLVRQYYCNSEAVSLVKDIYRVDFDFFSYSLDVERFDEPFKR